MPRAAALLTLVLLLVCVPAFATSNNSFAFSGSAQDAGADSEVSQGSGGPFSYSSFVGDAPYPLGLCNAGQLCTPSQLPNVQVLIGANFVPFSSSGCLGNVCSDPGPGHGLIGSLALIYNFSFITPNLKVGDSFSFVVPLQVNGVVTALGPIGQKLWTVDFAAKGTAEFLGFVNSPGQILFSAGIFSYSGTATVVPEPTTLLLSGSGVVAVYWRSRRKFRG